MTTKKWITGILATGALALLPAISAPAAVRDNPGSLLKDMQFQAQRARTHALQLNSFALDSDLGWQAYGDQLTQEKSAIDRMGRDLSRLQTVQQKLPPAQQRDIRRIATTLQLMTDNEDDAIHFYNGNQDALWLPVFHRYLNNLSTQSVHLTHLVKNAEALSTAGLG